MGTEHLITTWVIQEKRLGRAGLSRYTTRGEIEMWTEAQARAALEQIEERERSDPERRRGVLERKVVPIQDAIREHISESGDGATRGRI